MTEARFDLIVRNGSVIDGTGAPERRADVGVRGDRIVAVGDLGTSEAARTIDAAGRIVAPGFIDVHTHDDHALLAQPDMAFKASQGVTTVVAGNCGVSLAPLAFQGERPPPPLDLLGDGYRFPRMADYAAALDAAPPALNAAFLCGHSTLRVGTMDSLDRPATDREIGAMRERLVEALEAGAIGLSTGLYYPPAKAAPTSEIIALAEALSGVGGLYTTHLRDEGAGLIESMEEAFEIGRAAGIKVVLSHHKSAGQPNFGATKRSLELIRKVRETQKVAVDVYPYTAASTVLSADRVETASRVIITWSRAMPEHSGRDLADIAADLGCDPVAAAERLQPAGAIYFMMDEADVQRVIAFPHAIIASDGLPHDVYPHPRLWGTFPRVLGHYSRDLGLLPLEDAVFRMSGLPASEFGLTGRGTIAEGSFADLVVFDPATIIDRADFANPVQPAAGIEHVLVNGVAVWEDGGSTGRHPGKVLRRQELQAAAAGHRR